MNFSPFPSPESTQSEREWDGAGVKKKSPSGACSWISLNSGESAQDKGTEENPVRRERRKEIREKVMD